MASAEAAPAGAPEPESRDARGRRAARSGHRRGSERAPTKKIAVPATSPRLPGPAAGVAAGAPGPEPDSRRRAASVGAPPAALSFAREAVLSRQCPTFAACTRYLASLGLPEDALDASHNICWCTESDCAARHPNTAPRGTSVYGAKHPCTVPARCPMSYLLSGTARVAHRAIPTPEYRGRRLMMTA